MKIDIYVPILGYETEIGDMSQVGYEFYDYILERFTHLEYLYGCMVSTSQDLNNTLFKYITQLNNISSTPSTLIREINCTNIIKDKL